MPDAQDPKDRPTSNQTCNPPAQSMHEGIETWDDPVCSCEAEPRWQAVADELEKDEMPGKQQHSNDAEK